MPRKYVKGSSDSFDRMLDYEVRHSGWIMFRAIYWSILLLVLGSMLLYYSAKGVSVSLQVFFGFTFSIIAVMVLLYSFAETLHHKLMRKIS